MRLKYIISRTESSQASFDSSQLKEALEAVSILVGTNSDLGSHAIDEELPAHSELSKKTFLKFASRVNYKTYGANRINSEHDLLPDPQQRDQITKEIENLAHVTQPLVCSLIDLR